MLSHVDLAVCDATTLALPAGLLVDFIGSELGLSGIAFQLADYLELIDWSGRIVRLGKTGVIPSRTPPILTRLGIDDGALLHYVLPPTAGRAAGPSIKFSTAFGTPARLTATAIRWGRKFFKGLRSARRMFLG